MEGLRRIANVLAATEPENRNVLYLAGVPANVGTVNVATGLASVFDELGTRVIVVIATTTEGEPTAPGLTDLLAGEVPLEDIWKLMRVSAMHSLLPLGTKPEHLAKLVQGPKMAALLRILRDSAPVIIAGPALDSGAGVAIARHAGEVLLIVDGQSAKITDLVISQDLVRQVQFNLSGAVLLTHSPLKSTARHDKRNGPESSAATDSVAKENAGPLEEIPDQIPLYSEHRG